MSHPEVRSIQLVDPSKPVIETLIKKAKDSYISNSSLNIIHSKGQDVSITQHSNCIFIAGMGGKEIAEIIGTLIPKLDRSSKIVVSPHRKVLELRAQLGSWPLELLNEEVLFEDGQYYPVFSLRVNPDGMKVTPFGDALWETPVGKGYREHQVKAFKSHTDSLSRCYLAYLLSK